MEARKREITELVKAVGIKEFDITLRNNGHYEIKSDELNRQIFTGSTPSDRRGNLNLKADLRREFKGDMPTGSSEGSYSRAEIENILQEYKKSKSSEEVSAKYRISNASIFRWAKKFGVEVAEVDRGKSIRYTADIKNKAIKMHLDGVKVAKISQAMQVKGKSVYTWIANYKKHGFYIESAKNKVKEIAKKNLENNKSISHINSGKKSESTQQSADFENAISIISAAPLRIKELESLLAQKELEISDLKTKLEVVKEALAL